MQRLVEILLGLRKGFFRMEGDLAVRFDPHWPGPLIGHRGSLLNYLLFGLALALLVVLVRRRPLLRARVVGLARRRPPLRPHVIVRPRPPLRLLGAKRAS